VLQAFSATCVSTDRRAVEVLLVGTAAVVCSAGYALVQRERRSAVLGALAAQLFEKRAELAIWPHVLDAYGRERRKEASR
jgi:hypothetical protein